MRKRLNLILALGVLVILILVSISILKKINTKQNNQLVLESGSSGKLFIHPEHNVVAKKKTELNGPFPTDENIPEQDRNIGLLMNTWREAIVVKNIKDIQGLSIAIGRYGKESIPFMQKLALEDNNERVRAFATRSLGRMRNNELNSLFIDLLKNDKSPFVRENAAWSLGLLGDSNAIVALQLVADNDESTQVRQVAKKAINSIEESNKNRKVK